MIDVKQILVFGLVLLVPVWSCKMHRCYEQGELEAAAHRKLSTHYLQSAELPSTAPTNSPATCPVELYQQQPQRDIPGRSLAPWRYVERQMADHYPHTYVEAECLCTGCILIRDIPDQGDGPVVAQTHDYISHPIKQSRLFLKRELCSDGKSYHLKPVNHDVTVGCTCIRANTLF